ncbi:MAG: GMC oxidoreductase [Gemmatimonadota bacterium]
MSGQKRDDRHRDVIIIGSGFGGAMAAWPLVRAGLDVLMLERGPWVERGPHNWAPEGTVNRTPYYVEGPRFTAETLKGVKESSSVSCVGGPSVFYGGVSFRFREGDFDPGPEIVGDSGAAWPFAYETLRPFYHEAERILHVAGRAGEDPTEPSRTGGYPAPVNGITPVAAEIAGAAEKLGLHPFRLPLAINFRGNHDRATCLQCATCDTFACAIGAKNDLSVSVIPLLRQRGMELRTRTAAVRLLLEGGRAAGVEVVDARTGAREVLTADTIILAAGAVASPALLLSSGAAELNPAGDAVGRYLTRHCSGIVFGAYTWVPRYEGLFHKQIGINDFYFGDPRGGQPAGKLGNIQQTQTPAVGTVAGETGPLAGLLLGPLVRRVTGLLVIAEDRPRYENRVALDEERLNGLGFPRARVRHIYDERDLEARALLAARAREIHRAAGAKAFYFHKIDTFSHALGTVRMGMDHEKDPLDPDGRFRGLENVYVTDGSALPTSGGVNPSLTIAANALRVGASLAGRARKGDAARREAGAWKGGAAGTRGGKRSADGMGSGDGR